MLRYPSFIYLQNQKTGSTFVEDFLMKHCSEPLLNYQKHAVLDAAPGCFCFTNVREPLALYRSLFAYGLDGRGGIYQRLCANGFAGLYQQGPEGFPAWLEFMVGSEKADLLADHYSESIAKSIGIMTWRYLRLACPDFERAASSLTSQNSVLAYHDNNLVLGAVIRQEHLVEDLLTLIEGPLKAFIQDHDAATQWLASAPRVNRSLSSVDGVDIPEPLAAQIKSKEAILYKLYYSDQL